MIRVMPTSIWLRFVLIGAHSAICAAAPVQDSTLLSPNETRDPEIPKNIPPLVAMAVAVVPDQAARESDEWSIQVTLPRVRWRVVGEMMPKRAWPEVETSVAMETRKLAFGGPSQLRESKVVDLRGESLSRFQVFERLRQESPVLVSVSGQMVDGYYLQLTKPDSLIIILGPRDGSPTPELLPGIKENSAQKSTGAKEDSKSSR